MSTGPNDHDETPTGDAPPTDEGVTDEPTADEPTGGGPDDEWRRTGDEIRALGDAFKRHYAEPGEGEPGPSSEDLKDAARQFGRGLDRFFGAIGAAARDPETKESAKRAGSSLLEALGSTFDQLGKEAKEAFDKATDSEDEDDEVILQDALDELDDKDLIDELRSDLAEDEGDTTS